VQVFALLLLALGLLSLLSFSIAWRRSLGLTPEKRGAASLLTIDTRSLRYLIVRLGFSGTRRSETAARSRNWITGTLALCGSLLITFMIVLGGMLAFFTAIIAFGSAKIPVQLLLSAIAASAFTYIWLASGDWQSYSAVALDVSPESLASTPVSKLRLVIFSPLVALLFFALSIGMPVLEFGDARSLPSMGVWMAALFLAIGWFAALETLPFVRSTEPAPPALEAAGGGHRSFRASMSPKG
jgi:hypothetical protein